MLTAAYLALLLLLLPVILHRGYFDITESKHACFVLLSGAYVLCTLLLRIAACVRSRCGLRPTEFVRGMDAGDWLMLGFAAAYALSALHAPDWDTAFFAPTNRYQGLLTVLLYCAVWFCLSRNFAFYGVDEVALVAGFCTVCALAVAQGFGCDPLLLRRRLIPMDRMRYISTLGNINFYSGYIAVMMGFVLARWSTVSGWRRWLYAAALLFGAGGALFTGSDGYALAVIALCALLPLALFGQRCAMRRYLAGVLFLLLAMEALFRLSGGVRALSVSHMLRLVLNVPGILAVAGGCAGCLLAVRRMRQDTLLRCRKPYMGTLAAIAAVAVLALVLINTVWRAYSFGTADRFLKFNGSWGTDRGKVWRFCMMQYAAFDPLRQFIGGGPGCIYMLAGQSVFADAALDSAHNEYLHYLVTIGATGLACYLGMVGVTLRRAVRTCAQNPLLLALLMGVISYLAQAAVSIAQPASTPYLFVFLGLMQGTLRQNRFSSRNFF